MRRGQEQKPDVTIVSSEAQAPAQKPAPAKPNQIPVSFDEWYLQAAHGRNWRPAMKLAIKNHFEARGFMKSKDFKKGLEDFGIRS